MNKYTLINKVDIEGGFTAHYIVNKQQEINYLKTSIITAQDHVINYPNDSDTKELVSSLIDKLNSMTVKPEYTYNDLVNIYGIDSIVYKMIGNDMYSVTKDGIYNHNKKELISNATLEDAYNHYKKVNVIHRPFTVLLYGQLVKGRDYGIKPKLILIKNKVA